MAGVNRGVLANTYLLGALLTIAGADASCGRVAEHDASRTHPGGRDAGVAASGGTASTPDGSFAAAGAGGATAFRNGVDGGTNAGGGLPIIGGTRNAGGASSGDSGIVRADAAGVATGGGSSGGGAPSSGGARARAYSGPDLAPRCTSSAECPTFNGPAGFPYSSICCTPGGDCGLLGTGSSTASGCQALFQPGAPSASCSSGCCRFEGTCGVNSASNGLGCVNPADPSKATTCDVGGSCFFTFDVTSISAKGRYAPLNVGAIWIEDDAGHFIKTLTTWGTLVLQNAVAWEHASMGNRVDAISSATRRYHGPLIGSWNCTDVNHSPVPHGRYRVCITFAEQPSAATFDAGSSIELCEPFDIDGENLDALLPGNAEFANARVTITY